MGIKQRRLVAFFTGAHFLCHSQCCRGACVRQPGTPGSLYHQGKSQPPPRMIQKGGGLNYPMDLPVSPLTIGGTQGDQTPKLRVPPHCLNLVVWIYLCMLLQINIQMDCNMLLSFTAPFVLLFVYLLSWSNCSFRILNFSKEKSYTQKCIPVDFENNSGYYHWGQFSAIPQQVISEEALWYALALIGATKYKQKMQYLPSFWATC